MWICFKCNTAALLQSDSSAKAPHTECGIEGLRKCGLDPVQELHAIRDAVKCEHSCCMIQVDANTRPCWSWKIFALVVVHEGEFGVRAVQTPGLVVPAQAAFVAISFAADSLVGNCNVYLCPPPVHLPVTTRTSDAFTGQHLEWKGWNKRIKDKVLHFAWLIKAFFFDWGISSGAPSNAVMAWSTWAHKITHFRIALIYHFSYWSPTLQCLSFLYSCVCFHCFYHLILMLLSL